MMRAPMDILNVMWGGGSAFVSVHKVHRDILRLGDSGTAISSLLLQDGDAQPLVELGEVSTLGLSSGRIKGRGFAACRRWFDRQRLAKWIATQQPRLVLLDGIGAAAYILPLLYGVASIRAAVLFHGNKRLGSDQIKLLQRFPVDRLELIAVSETLAEDLERQIGRRVIGGRIALDPASLRASLLSREDALGALGLPLPAEGRAIGAVGRLVPEKGFRLLIEAVSEWLKAHPHDRLILAGEGPERGSLISLARDLGISGQVLLVGHLPDAPRIYRAFDLLCIPSQQEGLGLVLPEAVIAGVPVLATDLPVFREQLGGQRDGLIAAGQKAAWESALSRYLQGDLSELAEAQRAGLDPDRTWLRFVSFYRAILR